MISEEEEEEEKVTAVWRVQSLALTSRRSPRTFRHDHHMASRSHTELQTSSSFVDTLMILLSLSYSYLYIFFTLYFVGLSYFTIKSLIRFFPHTSWFFLKESSFYVLHSCILLYRDATWWSDVVNYWNIYGFLFICVCNLFIYTAFLGGVGEEGRVFP